MARTRSVTYCSIWGDPDWLALSGQAQRMYLLLLGQSRLNLAGVLDLHIGRWARMCCNGSVEGTETALHELEDARYVVVDWGTDELAIRSFTTHDLGDANMNIIKGMWTAWATILSPMLRSMVAHEIPDDLWERAEDHAPEEAVVMRASERIVNERRDERSDDCSNERSDECWDGQPNGDPNLLLPVSVSSFHSPRIAAPVVDGEVGADRPHPEKPAKRAQGVPDEFVVTPALRQWAAAKNITVDLDAQTEQFLDHHRAKGTTFKDWTAAWRTWMRNASRFAGTTNGVVKVSHVELQRQKLAASLERMTR